MRPFSPLSGEGDFPGKGLAPALSALREMQQDPGSRKPCRGECRNLGVQGQLAEERRRTRRTAHWDREHGSRHRRKVLKVYLQIPVQCSVSDDDLFFNSTMGSHTATSLAMPSSLGPKVFTATSRGSYCYTKRMWPFPAYFLKIIFSYFQCSVGKTLLTYSFSVRKLEKAYTTLLRIIESIMQ